jgi:hypothetical protein
MLTKKDLIKQSAGNYTLPTAIGVWTIEKRTSKKWEAYYDEKLHATVEASTLEKLIVEIEKESDFIYEHGISSLQYAIKTNMEHLAELDELLKDTNNYTEEVEEVEESETDIDLASETQVDHYSEYRRYDYTIPTVSDYNPINLSELFHNVVFSTVKTLAKFANIVADNFTYTNVMLVFLFVATYSAIPFAESLAQSMYIATLSILPFIVVCVKLSLLFTSIVAIPVLHHKFSQ